MQIFIKTLTGRKQQLNFENEQTVLEVKQALQEKEGIQVDQIRWHFMTKSKGCQFTPSATHGFTAVTWKLTTIISLFENFYTLSPTWYLAISNIHRIEHTLSLLEGLYTVGDSSQMRRLYKNITWQQGGPSTWCYNSEEDRKRLPCAWQLTCAFVSLENNLS